MQGKKLSKFNNVAKTVTQTDMIVSQLDRLFVLSEKAVINVFFCNNNDQLKQDVRVNLVDELPFQINNLDWLANYVLKHVKKNVTGFKLNVSEIKAFIENSLEFKAARENYISKLVKTLIIKKMNRIESKKIALASTKKNSVRRRLLYPYDKVFREEILEFGKRLGLDNHTVELILESNANLWRKQCMIQSFDEFYYPESEEPFDYDHYLQWYKLSKVHRDKWIQCYEYEYFLQHRDVIIEADTVTDNMRIGSLRYYSIIAEVNECNGERCKIIHDSKQFNESRII